MNQVVLTGRVTKDLEMNYTRKGVPVVSFFLSVSKNVSNEVLNNLKEKGKPTVNYIPCVAWNTRAEDLFGYVIKGSKIGITGELSIERDTDEDGNVRDEFVVVVDKVEFLEKMNSNEAAREIRQKEKERRKEILDN